jgi:hypothetical protein
VATEHHKKKFMHAMSEEQASKKFMEIWHEKHPGEDFNERYPGVFPWMESWHRLRQHDPVYEHVAQAFAEKVQHMINEKRALEGKIVAQREHLAKQQNQINFLIEELRIAKGLKSKP